MCDPEAGQCSIVHSESVCKLFNTSARGFPRAQAPVWPRPLRRTYSQETGPPIKVILAPNNRQAAIHSGVSAPKWRLVSLFRYSDMPWDPCRGGFHGNIHQPLKGYVMVLADSVYVVHETLKWGCSSCWLMRMQNWSNSEVSIWKLQHAHRVRHILMSVRNMKVRDVYRQINSEAADCWPYSKMT